MSENTHQNPDPEDALETPVSEPESKGSAEESAEATEAAADESTIGTGTSMALGCIAGTVLLIVFGLLFLLISTFF